MGTGSDGAEVDLQLYRAHSARMYDYFLGGTTNFAPDREAAGRAMAVFPWARTAARANRAFMHRSTRLLAHRGIEQFLDVGTGIPTSPNLHEVAQHVNPRARVVYVDNDPIVYAHAQALLHSTPQGRTAYVQADVREPEAILRSAGLRETLDLGRPVALSLVALLHFVPGEDDAHAIVERLKRAVPAGSALVLSHGTPDFAPAETERVAQVYRAAGTAVRMRTRAEIAGFFEGWQLLAPGLVASHRWRPDADGAGPGGAGPGAGAPGGGGATDAQVSAYAAVAVKP